MRRYLHRAISAAYLEPSRHYSVNALIELLQRTGQVPAHVPEKTLEDAIRSYARRNVLPVHTVHIDGRIRYLGAALRYPVPHLYPTSREQLMKESAAVTQERSPEPLRVEPTPGKEPGQGRAGKLRMVLLSSLFPIGVLMTAWGTSAFIDYIRSSPREIIEKGLEAKHLSYEEQYHLAEAHFETGDFDEASRLAYGLLSMSRIPPHLTGHAHFVIAKVESQRGHYENALGQAHLAREIYENSPEDRSGSIRNVQTFVTTILIRVERYHEALSVLETLYENELSPSYSAYIALKASSASFWLNKNGEALNWGRRARNSYQLSGDKTGLANALLNMAWLQIITNDLVSASQSLDEAEALVLSTGKDHIRPHLSLTRALYLKCMGKLLVLDEFENQQDPFFHRYVEFVEAFECSPMRISGDTPPPQGGNNPPPRQRERIIGDTSLLQEGNDLPPKKGPEGSR